MQHATHALVPLHMSTSHYTCWRSTAHAYTQTTTHAGLPLHMHTDHNTTSRQSNTCDHNSINSALLFVPHRSPWRTIQHPPRILWETYISHRLHRWTHPPSTATTPVAATTIPTPDSLIGTIASYLFLPNKIISSTFRSYHPGSTVRSKWLMIANPMAGSKYIDPDTSDAFCTIHGCHPCACFSRNL